MFLAHTHAHVEVLSDGSFPSLLVTLSGVQQKKEQAIPK
jgi:hypothetical protein